MDPNVWKKRPKLVEEIMTVEEPEDESDG